MHVCVSLRAFFFVSWWRRRRRGTRSSKRGERLRSLFFFLFRCTSPISLRYTTAGFFFFFWLLSRFGILSLTPFLMRFFYWAEDKTYITPLFFLLFLRPYLFHTVAHIFCHIYDSFFFSVFRALFPFLIVPSPNRKASHIYIYISIKLFLESFI